MRPGCSALALAVTQLRRAPVRTALLVLTVAALIFVVEFLATLSQTLQAFNTGALAHDRADVFVYAADAQGSLDASRLPPGSPDGPHECQVWPQRRTSGSSTSR